MISRFKTLNCLFSLDDTLMERKILFLCYQVFHFEVLTTSYNFKKTFAFVEITRRLEIIFFPSV